MQLIRRIIPFAAVLFLSHAALGQTLSPATLSITNFRESVAGQYYTTNQFAAEAQLLFTNCTAYSGTDTNSSKQILATNIIMTLRVGDSLTNTAYTASIGGANGNWWCKVVLPDTDPDANASVEMTMSNSTTGDDYTYPYGLVPMYKTLR